MEAVKKARGRPAKYRTDEERIKAIRRQQRESRDRIKKKLEDYERLKRQLAKLRSA